MKSASKSDHVMRAIAAYDSSANGESIDDYCRKIRFQQSKLFATSNSNGVTSTMPTVVVTKPVSPTPPVIMGVNNARDKRKSEIRMTSQSAMTNRLSLAVDPKLARSQSNLGSNKAECSASNRNLVLISEKSAALEASAKKWFSLKNIAACVSSKAKTKGSHSRSATLAILPGASLCLILFPASIGKPIRLIPE